MQVQARRQESPRKGTNSHGWCLAPCVCSLARARPLLIKDIAHVKRGRAVTGTRQGCAPPARGTSGKARRAASARRMCGTCTGAPSSHAAGRRLRAPKGTPRTACTRSPPAPSPPAQPEPAARPYRPRAPAALPPQWRLVRCRTLQAEGRRPAAVDAFRHRTASALVPRASARLWRKAASLRAAMSCVAPLQAQTHFHAASLQAQAHGPAAAPMTSRWAARPTRLATPLLQLLPRSPHVRRPRGRAQAALREPRAACSPCPPG
mmetsp:Transcript_26984/g.80015  ORF Transcript_26984/g.80015 Transcript_26984/m.80015 type:complete len:263 (+) Transcript_26984:423-1211(+)